MAGSDKIRSIQVLRGFAACAVVYDHAQQRAEIAWGLHTPLSDWVAHLGVSGVDLFFVLSGFLMAHLHQEQFGSGASLRFFSRRVVRIVPLYWILSGLAMAMVLLAPHSFSNAHNFSWSWTLGNFFFLPLAQSSGLMVHVLTVGWTLDYEMYFYVLFALAMLFRNGLMLLAVVLLGSFTLGLFFDVQQPWPKLLTSSLLLEFLSGIGVAVLLARVQLRAYVGWIALVAGTVLMVTSDPYDIETIKPDHIESRLWIFGIPWALVLFGCLVVGFRCSGAVGRKLSSLGDASYSIYLFQAFALPVAAFIVARLNLQHLAPDLVIVELTILGCVGGWLCWRVIEKPVTDALRRYTKGRFRKDSATDSAGAVSAT